MKKTRSVGLPIDKMVLGALLTALVVVLQFAGAFVKFGVFSVSLVLIPIAIGAIVCGPAIGAWLGFVFGMVVLLSGDAAWFMGFNAFGTVLTVLLKGSLAGFTAGLVYKLVSRFNQYTAAISAAIICPVVNSGVFALGCYAFFLKDLAPVASGEGYSSTTAYIFLFLIGGNFIFELLLNTVLSPVIATLVNLAKRELGRRKR
jgi:uncharacterized membrane protein